MVKSNRERPRQTQRRRRLDAFWRRLGAPQHCEAAERTSWWTLLLAAMSAAVLLRVQTRPAPRAKTFTEFVGLASFDPSGANVVGDF